MEKDIVFIDTGIFICSPYFKEGGIVDQLQRLAAENYINILLTEITLQEVRKHVKEDMQNRLNEILKCEKWLEAFPYLLLKSNAIDLDVNTESENYINNFISLANAFVIPYTFCQDSRAVFEKYFAQVKPFGIGKKSEFPDAFVLQALENYAKKSEIKKIIILSTDGDLAKYKSSILEWRDAKEYINKKLCERDDLMKYIQAFENDWLIVKRIVEEHIGELFKDDWDLYKEDSFIDIESLEVTNLDVTNILRKNVIDSTEDTIVFEVFAHSSLQVDYEFTNYDNAIHDNEDDIWYGDERGSGCAKSQGTIKFLISCKKKEDNKLDNYQITEWDYRSLEDMENIREPHE